MFNYIFNNLAQTAGNSQGYTGTFKIISGISFSPALQDKSSGDFKVLAFDVEHLVRTSLSLVEPRVCVSYINFLT